MSVAQRFAGFDPTTITALVNEPVVRQHAEDAAFLWGQRDASVFAPNFRLKDLARWDGRVEAHLDGLRVAGEFGWALCAEALGGENPGAVFAATVLAFGGADAVRIARVVEAGVAAPELARGLISALGWLEFETVEPRLRELLVSSLAEIRRVGIAAFAIHRQDPGEALIRAVSNSDLRLGTRAIQAAGELGRSDLLSAIRPALASADPETAFRAGWSAALLGDRDGATRALDVLARGASDFAEPALATLSRIVPPDRAVKLFDELRRNPARKRLAAISAGAIGLPDLVPDLMALFEDPSAARAAGEAFAWITGADLEYLDLDGEPPKKPEGSDEAVPPVSVDDDLPWPSLPRVEAWWKKHHSEFEEGMRHVLGKPLNREALNAGLIQGNQRQRAAAAFEIALRDPSRPLFETRSRGDWQTRRIRSWTS